MPSEGRGILSPVRLPVPPLQQLVLLQQLSMILKPAHCSGSCSGSHFTLFSFAARSALRCLKYVSSFSAAPATSDSSTML